MNNRFSSLLHNANTNLKPLGKKLFWLYITLFVLGCSGMIFGVCTLVLKIADIGSAAMTPWWEIGMLIIVSWYVTKTFIQESFNLVSKDKPKPIRLIPETSPNIVPIQKIDSTSSKDNVIPFYKRKSSND